MADLTRLQTKSAFIYEAVESLNILNSCGTSKVLLFFLLLLSLGRLCSCLLLLLLFLRLERWERKKETSLPSTTARHNSMTGAKLKQQSSNQSATLDEDRRRHWPRLQDQPFILFQCIWLYVSVFLPTALGLLLLLFFSFLRSNPCPLFGLLLLLLLLGLQLSSERWLQWLQTKKIKALELRFKISFGAFAFYSAPVENSDSPSTYWQQCWSLTEPHSQPQIWNSSVRAEKERKKRHTERLWAPHTSFLLRTLLLLHNLGVLKRQRQETSSSEAKSRSHPLPRLLRIRWSAGGTHRVAHLHARPDKKVKSSPCFHMVLSYYQSLPCLLQNTSRVEP